MSDHTFLAPGYVVRPEHYGPDFFENVGGIGWTDQQGLTRGWGTTFRGKANVRNWFHLAVTSPTIEAGVRVKCNSAAVTLDMQPTDAFLQAFHVYDRTNRFFVRDGLNITGNYGDKWVPGENMFGFPDHEVDGAIGVSVLIFFDAPANVTFTGVGVNFHT